MTLYLMNGKIEYLVTPKLNYMNSQGLNLFIVDDNPVVVIGLRNFLKSNFGASLNISTFLSGESAIKKVNKDTDIVILDYYLPDENGNEVLVKIKEINPKTEVIMLTSNEDVKTAVESFRKGASDYVIKGDKAFKKIIKLVYKTMTYPLIRMGQEFGLSKLMMIFLGAFIFVGFVVFLFLKVIPYFSSS
jgi:response regulator RpfG family c-di-GMP phosphodiesterase